jgi:tetratricopeptide (TPR) repeat protein
MNQSRLSQLLRFYEEEPNDPFNIYALANEYKNSDPEKGLKYFEMLMRDHPSYIATYYHLAHLYIDLGKDDLAKATFEKGINIATKNNESFALRELKSAYEEFTMDD